MADNVLESGPPSAKRPKLSSPALSVSASDGNGKYIAFIYKLGGVFFSFRFNYNIGYFLNSCSLLGAPVELNTNLVSLVELPLSEMFLFIFIHAKLGGK